MFCRRIAANGEKMNKEFLLIGTVLKPQGIHGECKIKPYASREDMFFSWKTLYQEDHGDYKPLKLKTERIHGGFVYAYLAGSTSANEAEAFRGLDLYIDRAHAAPAESGSDYIADLLGCEAAAEDGSPVGTLTDVLQYGSVDTWVFRTPDGRTMMAPALLSVFTAVDTEEGRISVCVEKLREVAVFDD